MAKCKGTFIAITFKNKRKATFIAIAIVGRAITIEKVIKKRSKELMSKFKHRQLRTINLKGALEKSPILMSQYWEHPCIFDFILYLCVPIISSPPVYLRTPAIYFHVCKNREKMQTPFLKVKIAKKGIVETYMARFEHTSIDTFGNIHIARHFSGVGNFFLQTHIFLQL